MNTKQIVRGVCRDVGAQTDCGCDYDYDYDYDCDCDCDCDCGKNTSGSSRSARSTNVMSEIWKSKIRTRTSRSVTSASRKSKKFCCANPYC